jgi:hypothetical protein
MRERQRKWIAFGLLLTAAFAFRFYLAHYLPNDTPGDSKVYEQMARNILEQHVYSHDSEPPYSPSIIRLPGYALFLSGIYSIFGHYNNTAVRLIQTVLDTLTCGLVGLIAFYWEPDERRKRAAAIGAVALAAVCPFTAIYVATVLTETWASLLAVTLCLLATLAVRAKAFRNSLWLWSAVGLVGGVGVFMRPDSGLFVAAVGLALLVPEVFGWYSSTENVEEKITTGRRLSRVVGKGAVLSAAFVLVLVPWTVRNWRTFHMFQPLSPTHGEMPGEFVPHGYYTWVRTWLDDRRYIETVLWSLDDEPIDADDLPANAFDSEQEKARVVELLDHYNSPADADETTAAEEPSPSPTPTPTPMPQKAGKTGQAAAAKQSPSPGANDKDKADQSDEDEKDDQEQPAEPEQPVSPAMTPTIDAAFGQIARERIARSPGRHYLWLPLKRASSLWFGPHSDYYPFAGELFPLTDLDHSTHQHIWLPLFTGLVWIYSLLGVAGGWCLWRARSFIARRWLLLAVLLIFLRLAFFSTMENPEPRYSVELFPFLAILGGIAISRFSSRIITPRQPE